MSDEPKHGSHLLRLAGLMLAGALLPIPFSIGPGNNLDFWHYAAPYAQSLTGTMLGLSIDLWLRLIDVITQPR